MADTIYNKTADPNIRRLQARKGITNILIQRLDIRTGPPMTVKVILGGVAAVPQSPINIQITFTVTEYAHGSHKTRESRKYNGMDVSVGDWIAGSQDGKCLQIVSVTSKSTTSVTVIAEDVDRYNAFRSSTGSQFLQYLVLEYYLH